MKNKLIRSIRTVVLLSGITLGLLAPLPFQKASADDLTKGMRGPTNWQLDSRVSYFEAEQKVKLPTGNSLEQNVKLTGGNVILKGWSGDKLGLTGFINFPYRSISIDTPAISSEGFGDISFGGGPRGRIGDFHWTSYLSLTLPTGDEEARPPLGNGRLDTKIGALGTYLIRGGRYEFSGILERNFTGENNFGINPPDELYTGIIGGVQVTKGLRLGTGPTYLRRDNGEDLLNWRGILRYTISPELHFQLVVDRAIAGDNVPKPTGAVFSIRYNFDLFK